MIRPPMTRATRPVTESSVCLNGIRCSTGSVDAAFPSAITPIKRGASATTTSAKRSRCRGFLTRQNFRDAYAKVIVDGDQMTACNEFAVEQDIGRRFRFFVQRQYRVFLQAEQVLHCQLAFADGHRETDLDASYQLGVLSEQRPPLSGVLFQLRQFDSAHRVLRIGRYFILQHGINPRRLCLPPSVEPPCDRLKSRGAPRRGRPRSRLLPTAALPADDPTSSHLRPRGSRAPPALAPSLRLGRRPRSSG